MLLLVAACAAFAWPDDSPLVPRNAGHPTGSSTWAWAFLGCAIAAFAFFALGLALLARRRAGLAPVAALAAAIQLVPLGAPLLLSTDAWTYWDYGRISTVHGGNPYADTPRDFPDDAAFRHVGTGWRDTHAVYGPAFTLASEPVALAAGSSASAAAWIYKSIAALCVLGGAALAARLARAKAFAAAFVGWNPLLALHFAGGGHNDAWMAVLVVGALALAAAGRRQLAGVAWAGAVLVKWVPLVLLPLRAIEARASRRRVGHAGFAAAVLVVAAVASWRYGWHWLSALGPLARNANTETSFSIPHRFEQLGLPHAAALTLVAFAAGAVYVWLVREAWRGRARLGLAACLLLLATPYLAVWYVVWAAPLAAVEDDRTAQLVVLAISAYLLRQTIPL